MQESFLASVLLPLAERSGEVAQIEELLCMLERCFVDTFGLTLARGGNSGNEARADGGAVRESFLTTPRAATSLDGGEEAKLLVVRAVSAFHRRAARRHGAFFRTCDYHPHAALFLLELLKSLSGNSQQWFRQLQLESLGACLAIVEAIGMENVRLCLPGVVSVAVRYIHRAHHGKDSAKVCLTAISLLRASLTISFASAEPVSWVRDTAVHLTSALRALSEPTALARAAHTASTVCALKSLVSAVLLSPAVATPAAAPLRPSLTVAYAIIDNMDNLRRLNGDVLDTTEENATTTRCSPNLVVEDDGARMSALLTSSCATEAVTTALQCLRGVELLHLATTVARVAPLRDHFFPLTVPSPHVVSGMVESVDASEPTVALFLSVVRKCVRVVGTVMSEEALYTHRRPRSYPAGVVDEFLFCLAGALARTPTTDGAEETVGERLTNALLSDYDAVLRDWDAYATHPAVLYVLCRLVLWQFHPTQSVRCAHHVGLLAAAAAPTPCLFPRPADLMAGAFEQLWSVVAQPHLWAITRDEDLCSYQQVRHRQVVAATLLRFLALSAEGLASTVTVHADADGELTAALERLFALTLYLVLEKATATGIVREAALQCVEAYSSASGAADALQFLLCHSSLIVDETERAIRAEHLRPAAASVLRGSLVLMERRLMRGAGDRVDTSGRASFEESGIGLVALVRQRLSPTELSVRFALASARVPSLEEAAQVADFVSSTIHVACEALQLCSRYESAGVVEDLQGRKAAVSLLRSAFDLAAYLNFCVPQEAMDEEQERRTTSAHTRVRSLQVTTLEAMYAVLQYCTQHNHIAASAVQATVRGLTCFLTTSAALTWADAARQRLVDAAAERRRLTLNSRRGGRTVQRMAADGEGEAVERVDGDRNSDDEGGDPCREPLPNAPIIDWPWTRYGPSAEGDPEAVAGAASAVSVELPRSHLHTVYRVYLTFVALLREPIAAFAPLAVASRLRTAVELRKLGDVALAPALLETLNGLEALRVLALEFLRDRMVEEVLPLVLLWHERACLSRIPTHTEERVKLATQQFIECLYADCAGFEDQQEAMRVGCLRLDLLPGPARSASGDAAPL